MGWLGQGEGNGKLSVEVSYHVVFGSQRGGADEGSFCRQAAGARQAGCICRVPKHSPRQSVQDEGNVCVWGLVGHGDDQLVC